MALVARSALANSPICLHLAERHVLSGASSVLPQRRYSDVRIIKNPTTASLKRGTGGRSSFNGNVCTVFGNSGFLGRYVCSRLGQIGTQLVLPYRGNVDDNLWLKLMGDLGQTYFVPFDLTDIDSIRKCVKYSNVVINLVGCHWETKNFTFEDVHVKGARNIARVCRESNIDRLIHVSCLNAHPDPKPIVGRLGSQLLKSKWEGECAVREEFPNATIVKPSDVYGQEDHFINLYMSKWRRHFRGMPLWKNGQVTEKQPVWAGDVGRGIAAIIDDRKTAGKTYQFVGPRRYKLSELAMWIGKLSEYRAEEQGYRVMDFAENPLFRAKIEFLDLFTTSQRKYWEILEKEHTTDVISKDLPTLEDLGVVPTTMESRIKWECAPMKFDAYYMERLGEFDPPDNPKTVPLQ